MSLAEQIAADQQEVFFNPADFAVAADWNGTAVHLLVSSDDDEQLRVPGRDGRAIQVRALVRKQEVAAPEYRDLVEINGHEYHVVRIMSEDEQNTDVLLERNLRPRL